MIDLFRLLARILKGLFGYNRIREPATRIIPRQIAKGIAQLLCRNRNISVELERTNLLAGSFIHHKGHLRKADAVGEGVHDHADFDIPIVALDIFVANLADFCRQNLFVNRVTVFELRIFANLALGHIAITTNRDRLLKTMTALDGIDHMDSIARARFNLNTGFFKAFCVQERPNILRQLIREILLVFNLITRLDCTILQHVCRICTKGIKGLNRHLFNCFRKNRSCDKQENHHPRAL